MIESSAYKFSLSQFDSYCKLSFFAMACPCEILLDTQDTARALDWALQGMYEAQRIEQKFSRYRDDNIVYAINSAQGKRIEVDEETANLLDFAQQIHTLSLGSFDITSGILRKLWRFDGSENIPSPEQVNALMPLVGWQYAKWYRPFFTLRSGMEIDLGGIGKEYAVDKAFELVAGICDCAILVNFGGDLRARGVRANGCAWQVGIEKPVERLQLDQQYQQHQQPSQRLDIVSGAMATSGDSYRFLQKDGVRYSHILDPRTGWPVAQAPKSITVAAPTCVQAGLYSTLALLKGVEAERFLEQQNVQFWSVR